MPMQPYTEQRSPPLCQDLGDSMPDDCSGFLGVFFRQTDSDTDFQSRLRLPDLIFGSCAEGHRHSLKAGYHHTICETL